MTVKRYGRGPGASYIGKPALHPATVDLKSKSYEYVNPVPILLVSFKLKWNLIQTISASLFPSPFIGSFYTLVMLYLSYNFLQEITIKCLDI